MVQIPTGLLGSEQALQAALSGSQQLLQGGLAGSEQALQGGTTNWAGGFCVVTDGDGDTVNLHWQSTKGYPGADIDTRGDYYSGTGKYEGITGHYTFHCEIQAGTHFFCSVTGGEYSVP